MWYDAIEIARFAITECLKKILILVQIKGILF